MTRKKVENYFLEHLTDDIRNPEGFYEKLYYNQSYCWNAFIRQDFLMYYRYTQKWVDLFTDAIGDERNRNCQLYKGTAQPIKCTFHLKKLYVAFRKALQLLEDFRDS